MSALVITLPPARIVAVLEDLRRILLLAAVHATTIEVRTGLLTQARACAALAWLVTAPPPKPWEVMN